MTDINEWRNRDTAALLRHLNSRFDAGDLAGLVVQALDFRGEQTAFFTGAYRRDPDAAAGSSLRLSMEITMQQTGLVDV